MPDAYAQTAARRRAHEPAGAPRALHGHAVAANLVLLRWKPPRPARHHRRHRYRVFRNGRAIATTTKPHFTDTGAGAGTAYRYRVRALKGRNHLGPGSRVARVRTPFAACTPAALAHRRAPGPGAPPFKVSPATRMTIEMVDRVFWRAGFGPSDHDRHTWIGRPLGQLVDWLLGTSQSYRASATPALSGGSGPIDPLVNNTELVLDWVDRMQRAVNPLTERLTFFWHRHWAVSRSAGIPAQFLLAYRDRLARYSDLAAHPTASFRGLALEMTTQDAAMSQFLNSNQNVRAHPNENYAREFMELFCLGITDTAGRPTYSQADVQQLARAFTGWRLNRDSSSPGYGQVTFAPRQFDSGPKTILGKSGAFDAPAAVDVVLSHPAHGPHLVAKLWSEFIATPIPAAALAALSSLYTSSGGLLIAPLMRAILTHPLLFESLCEPNLVKPPIVHVVGTLRAMDVPLSGASLVTVLGDMQQSPYNPPNVAGWEGGLSWLNSNTAKARFDLVVRCQNLKYGGYPGTRPVPDVPGETGEDAYARAWRSVGAPWLSGHARARLLALARRTPSATAAQRRQRIYSLQAAMLGGPDGQVM